MTKHDKKGYSGKVEQWKVGIERYYQNIMNDQFKNECVLLLQCKHYSQKMENYGIKQQISQILQGYEPVYRRFEALRVTVVTWN